MSDYTRPASAFRFSAGGLNTVQVADALSERDYTLLQNIRWYSQTECRTRPGLTETFSTSSGQPILNISSYSTINTNNAPRYLAASNGNIYLDTGTMVDTGYSTTRIPTMIPYRPNQSPQSWMYIADGTQYHKLSAPDVTTGIVTAEKTGVIEPQSSIDASPLNPNFIQIGGSGGAPWVVGGDASGLTTGNRSTDTILSAFSDPANTQRVSIQVGSSVQYQIGEIVALHRVTDYVNVPIQDVLPAINSPLAVQNAWNQTGNLLSERWTIVPTQPSTFSQGSIFQESFIASIRRGSIVSFSGSSGLAFVTEIINGPDGIFCFTVQFNGPTTNPLGDTISGVSTIIVGVGNPTTDVIVGNAIIGDGVIGGGNVQSFTVTYSSGVGTLTTNGSLGFNPFVFQNFSFQEDDYIHFSVKVDNLLNLIQGTIVFDVNNGSADYLSNAYYYSFVPNTIQQGISGNTTQLGIAQLVVQQNLIDAQVASESNNQGSTSAPAQTATGDNQWSEIWFNISALTRIGNDQTRSLANTQGVRFIFDVLPGTTTDISISSVMTYGGGQVDVGDVGAPYQYLIRPRNSSTGAKGNPSPVMFYGVSPRRQNVILTLPATYPDSQIDVFDIYRFGGALSAYTFLGFVNVGITSFTDIYPDDAIASSDQIEYDNYEPWPTIGLPITISTVSSVPAVSIIGNFINIFLGSGNPIPTSGPLPDNLLPGNLVYINQTVFTTRTRPFLFTIHSIPLDLHYQVLPIVENGGSLVNTKLFIYEPALANQNLPYMWGPDEYGGTIFAVGDPLRPGFVSFCKNFNPDSAPDSYNIELCPPSEPLLGGVLLNGNSYVFSTERCWFLRPSFGQTNQYTPQEVPTGRGLAAPFGITSDGKVIYFISKDGIYITSGAAAQSLTMSLYNLFPHEGIQQEPYTYNSVTIFPPDYTKVSTFKLNYNKGYLYFDFQDTQGQFRTLTFDTKNQGWCLDLYVQSVTHHYSVVPSEGSLPVPGSEYPMLLMGDSIGNIYFQTDDVNDAGQAIQCYVSTREWTAGDDRAQKEWGDVSFDALPTQASHLTVTPMSLGSPISGLTPSSFVGSVRNQQGIVNLDGDVFSFSLGLFISWSQTYGLGETSPVTLYVWQPSYISKPETIANRFTDWDNCGILGAKYFQGYIIEMDSFNNAKLIGVRNNDTGLIQQIDSLTRNGQGELAVSFEIPFVAHMVRLEPQDTIDWKYYNIRWVFESTPETVNHWQTQFSSLSAEAYTHVKELEVAYASNSAVTFTLSYDSNIQTYTLPSTSGVYTKAYLIMQPNKGKLYSFTFDAPTPGFSLWLDDCRVMAGAWGRASSYISYAHFGGKRGDGASI